MHPNINILISRSIPLDHNLKRYFISKYRYLVKHNGLEFANKKFKELLDHCRSYVSGEHNVPLTIRKSGWIKKLYGYLGSNPEWVLNFLKLYSWTGKPDPEKAAKEFKNLLDMIRPMDTPSFINTYVKMLDMSYWALRTEYLMAKIFPGPYSRYCKYHAEEEWINYWKGAKWRWSKKRGGRKPDGSASPSPFPESYRDNGEEAYARDYYYHLRYLAFNSALPSKVRDFCISKLSPGGKSDYVACKQNANRIRKPNSVKSPFGTHGGQIHFIPKNGTGYRPIAVPNRFLQECLYEAHLDLVSVLQGFASHDGTFDQSKFNDVIQSRVNTDDRYVGSLDLSNATDRLPLGWFNSVSHRLDLHQESWWLFNHVARGVWDANGLRVQWKSGQPLGTLPSFQVLALTQHLILEALSLEEGYGHRPYRILGDDLILFSKRLRNRYLREMEKRHVKISLNKSYSGKLTQFAGMTFVKNGMPFLTPDHSIITKNSLFDWQQSTGILIPYRNLPRYLRKGWTESQYNLVQLAMVPLRGRSRPRNVTDHAGELLAQFFKELLSTEEVVPDAETSLGFVLINGHSPAVISSSEKKRDGLFTRYRKTNLPTWFKQKFRPYEVHHLLTVVRKIELQAWKE